MSWVPKLTDDDTTSWYDCITPVSDLRNAQPGDLIFWNNDGEKEDHPRAVSHVVLVLDRLSYDSDNPDQPLLLLAEATSRSSIGVQTCYYMYDTRNSIKRDTAGKIEYETEVIDGEVVFKYKDGKKIPKRVVGSNEHKIPKFICRPKYQRLIEEAYQDITGTKVDVTSAHHKTIDAQYQVTYDVYTDDDDPSNKGITYTKVKCKGSSERRLVTIEFDWVPREIQIDKTATKKGTASRNEIYLSIWHGAEGEILRYYAPLCSAGVPYRVKLVVPLHAYVSTSKNDQILNKELQNEIIIREAYLPTPYITDPGRDTEVYVPNIKYYTCSSDTTAAIKSSKDYFETLASIPTKPDYYDTATEEQKTEEAYTKYKTYVDNYKVLTDNKIDISNVVIYEGIKLTDYADC
jgi:hypothetical protein